MNTNNKTVIGDCTLLQGDCLEILPQINQKVDLVLTDLPYGTTQCKWDTIIPMEQMWESLNPVCNPSTPMLFFGTEPFSSNLRMSNIKNFRYDWVWLKNTSGSFAVAKKMPMKYHEMISVFYKKLPKYNPQFEEYNESVKRRFKEGEKQNSEAQSKHSTNKIHGGLILDAGTYLFKRGHYPRSYQYFKSVHTANGNRLHPSQKPIDLLEYLIKTYTDEGDMVLDFTMGSGSTGVACQNTNRNYIGIEIEPEYYQIAEERLQENKKQTKLM